MHGLHLSKKPPCFADLSASRLSWCPAEIDSSNASLGRKCLALPARIRHAAEDDRVRVTIFLRRARRTMRNTPGKTDPLRTVSPLSDSVARESTEPIPRGAVGEAYWFEQRSPSCPCSQSLVRTPTRIRPHASRRT